MAGRQLVSEQVITHPTGSDLLETALSIAGRLRLAKVEGERRQAASLQKEFTRKYAAAMKALGIPPLYGLPWDLSENGKKRRTLNR